MTISGERREGYWRSEREDGQFRRTIPLPEGVIAEIAKATFHDGVLEIQMAGGTVGAQAIGHTATGSNNCTESRGQTAASGYANCWSSADGP